MKHFPTKAAATYTPMQYKNFAGALGAFFASECPHLGGQRVRRVLVEAIEDLIERFYPPTTHLRPGQVPWITIAKDDRPSFAKRVTDYRLAHVILDLVRPQDAVDLAAGASPRTLLREAVARLFVQADAQGGCMTNVEVAVLLKITPRTVTHYIHRWEHAHGRVLPRRGTIHDIGPTLTHKAEIVRKLFVEGKSVEQVCRETHHSPEAVHRYITAFKQVLLLRRNELSAGEIAYVLAMSPRLVAEYNRLIDQLADDNLVLQHLLHSATKEV